MKSYIRSTRKPKAMLYSDYTGTFIGEYEYDACCSVGKNYYDPELFEKIGTGHISEINGITQIYTRETIQSYDFYRRITPEPDFMEINA